MKFRSVATSSANHIWRPFAKRNEILQQLRTKKFQNYDCGEYKRKTTVLLTTQLNKTQNFSRYNKCSFLKFLSNVHTAQMKQSKWQTVKLAKLDNGKMGIAKH